MAFPETIYISFLYILPEDPTNILSKGRVDKRHERKIFSLNQAPQNEMNRNTSSKMTEIKSNSAVY